MESFIDKILSQLYRLNIKNHNEIMKDIKQINIVFSI